MTSERIRKTIDGLLDQCEEVAHQRDWDLVLDKAKRVLRMDPENARANAFVKRVIDTWLDQCAEASLRGDFSFVLDTAKRVLDADPKNADAITFVQLAEDEQEAPKPSRPIRRKHFSEQRGRTAAERLPSDTRVSGLLPTFGKTAQQGLKATKPTLFVVYSSASADEKYKQELKKHLSNLKREGVLFFNPPDFLPDDDSLSGLRHHVDDIVESFSKADVILLLMSPDYMDAALQEGPKKLEFDLALKNLAERHNVQVVPVILRSCNWKTVKELERLRAVPEPEGKPPVIEIGSDTAFTELSKWLVSLARPRQGATDGLEKPKRPDGARSNKRTSLGVVDSDRP